MSTSNSWDVVVVGAGMAGLAAARTLQAAGRSVVVVEARERIGGRIHTDRSFAPVPVEWGAELVHGQRADTWPLVRAADLTTAGIGLVVERNKRGTWQPIGLGGGSSSDLDLRHVPRPNSTESLGAYLRRLGVRPSDWPTALHLLEMDTESVDRWSALDIYQRFEAEADHSDDSVSVNHRILGGYDQLLAGLEKGLDIRLAQPITQVRWDAGRVTLTSADATSYTARCAVLTLPVGVWKARRIGFVPDLPAEKWSAVDSLGICDIVKLILHLDRPALPRGADAVIDSEGLLPFWWDVSSGYPQIDGQVVVGWAAGDAARRLIAMGEAAAVAAGTAALRTLSGQNILNTHAGRLFHWNDDPYAGGAYTYTPPGATDARRTLAASLENVLFFAGEATEDHQHSTVHGAYRSGLQAAREVLTVLR